MTLEDLLRVAENDQLRLEEAVRDAKTELDAKIAARDAVRDLYRTLSYHVHKHYEDLKWRRP